MRMTSRYHDGAPQLRPVRAGSPIPPQTDRTESRRCKRPRTGDKTEDAGRVGAAALRLWGYVKALSEIQKKMRRAIAWPFKGMLGELAVRLGAGLTLPSPEYRRYHNVTLRTADGTTQIDHVIVSVFGVFVVETKNMRGLIYGRKWDREWSQVFPGRGKFRFQNPLRQNHRHVRAVEDALRDIGLPEGAVKSVVVFAGGAELKRRLPENVTVGLGGSRYLRSFRTVVLSEAQAAAACAAIEAARMRRSWGTKRRHARGLEERHDGARRRACPQCGRRMVLRTGQRGPAAGERFWGCTGFPICRRVEEVKG